MTEHFSPQFKITVLMVDATRAPSHQQTQPRGDGEGSEEPTQAGPPREPIPFSGPRQKRRAPVH